MMLIAIGENIKKVDKITDGHLLRQFPPIPWQGVKGTRDVIAHDYFGIDPEEIFNICSMHLASLKRAILQMKEGL
jgi:uncharacterized protein with HEPN domain